MCAKTLMMNDTYFISHVLTRVGLTHLTIVLQIYKEWIQYLCFGITQKPSCTSPFALPTLSKHPLAYPLQVPTKIRHCATLLRPNPSHKPFLRLRRRIRLRVTCAHIHWWMSKAMPSSLYIGSRPTYVVHLANRLSTWVHFRAHIITVKSSGRRRATWVHFQLKVVQVFFSPFLNVHWGPCQGAPLFNWMPMKSAQFIPSIWLLRRFKPTAKYLSERSDIKHLVMEP